MRKLSRSSLVRSLVLAALLAALGGPATAANDAAKAVERSVELGTPRPVSVSWTELVVDVPVRVKPVGVSGHVDSVTFSDLELNGAPFEVDPYTASFDLPEDDPITLPRPLRIRVRFARVAPGVVEEAVMPSDTLRLRGHAKVDGTFRKWIFSARRTVDVPIDVSGPNPLADYHPLKLALEELREWERRGWQLPF
jgi:hypothetical protein